MTINMYKYWGKAKPPKDTTGATYHLLVYHSLDVAAVGKAILERQPDWTQPLQTQLNLTLEQATILVIFFLAIHDLGKFAESFQGLNAKVMQHLQGVESKQPYSIRHDSMGWILWRNSIWGKMWETDLLSLDKSSTFGTRPDKLSWQSILSPFAQAVTGHHGKPPTGTKFGSTTPLRAKDCFNEQSQEDAWKFTQEIANLLTKDLDKWLWNEDLTAKAEKLSWLLAGFAVLCDWVGSNQYYFPYCDQEMPLEKYWKKAQCRAKKALDELAILPAKVNTKTGMEALFKDIQTPSPLQNYASECLLLDEPQMFIIEETTGAGKTEAAIVLAHRLMAQGLARGIFIGLPTMATANAMYKRIIQCYDKMFTEPTSLVLAHSKKHLSKEFTQAIKKVLANDSQSESPKDHSYAPDEASASAQCSAWLANSNKTSLLAAVGVGTIDQALLAVLTCKHQSLRLYGLASKVLIVDEVHAYDTYINKLLNILVEFQAALGGSVILLSATLPNKTRQGLAKSFSQGLAIWKNSPLASPKLSENPQYPWLTQIGSICCEKQIESRPCTERIVQVQTVTSKPLDLIKQWHSEGRCICWIRNTVNDAIEAYQVLCQTIDESDLTLFHARFVMGDRLDIENAVLKNFGSDSTSQDRKSKVVIATQVVEQSLDLDFDIIISDLAPIDLLIQRMGRQMRHPRDKEGNRFKDAQGKNCLGIDQRGEIRFYVYAPEFTNSPEINWFTTFSPGSAWIYPHHGQIWLTLKYIQNNPTIELPKQSRALISAVYDEAAQEDIPNKLQPIEDKQIGKEIVAKSEAGSNSLQLDKGYSGESGKWLEDTLILTRLAEPSTNIRLACWEGEELRPWRSGEFEWDMSQLSVRAALISEVDTCFTGKLAISYSEMVKRLPDEGKYSKLLVLTKVDEQQWQGKVFKKIKEDQRLKELVVIYHKKLGLYIKQ